MANEKRLIAANALKQFVCELCNSINSDEPCEPADCRCMSLIDMMPTVDAVEVVHGRWERTYVMGGIEHKHSRFMVKCSVCGWGNVCQYNYCPNCGAKMDGDGNA